MTPHDLSADDERIEGVSPFRPVKIEQVECFDAIVRAGSLPSFAVRGWATHVLASFDA